METEQCLPFHDPPVPVPPALKREIDLPLGMGFRPADLAVRPRLQWAITPSGPSPRTAPDEGERRKVDSGMRIVQAVRRAIFNMCKGCGIPCLDHLQCARERGEWKM